MKRVSLITLGLLGALLIGGCAGAPAPPPQATAIPYSPTLITLDRASYANDWKVDVNTREAIDQYVRHLAEKAKCTPTWWVQVNNAWEARQGRQFTTIMTFQPIPNAPAQSNSAMDLITALVGTAVKVAPMFMMKSAGALPPCTEPV